MCRFQEATSEVGHLAPAFQVKSSVSPGVPTLIEIRPALRQAQCQQPHTCVSFSLPIIGC